MLETGFVSDIILFSHLFQQEEIENFTLTFFNWKKKLPYLLSLALAVDASCCPSHSDDHSHDHSGDHTNGHSDDHSNGHSVNHYNGRSDDHSDGDSDNHSGDHTNGLSDGRSDDYQHHPVLFTR